MKGRTIHISDVFCSKRILVMIRETQRFSVQLQFKEAAKNVPAQPSKKVIVRTTAPGAQLSPTYEEPVSPRRSPRTSAHAQPTVTLAAPSAGVGAPVMMEEPPQGEEAQVLVRKVVKRKVFNL